MRAIRGGSRHRAAACAAALAMTTGLLAAVDGARAPQAQALTPPVAVTADELPTWQTNGIVFDLAVADGIVFAGGTFTAVRPPGADPGVDEQPARNFVALDAATGEPVAGCDFSFTVGSGTETVRALEVSPDKQTLYVGGRFGAVNGIGASSVAAIDIPTCTLKPFPVAASNTVRGLAVADDAVYLTGDFTSLNGSERRYFGAVDTSGALLDWVADGDEIGHAVAIAPGGDHVVLGGDFFEINGVDSHALAVVDAGTGAMVRDYPLGFIETRSVVKDLDTDATGVYTANEGTGGGVFDGRIALDAGTYDERWRDTCLGATQAVHVYQEVLYSGHHAHDCSSMGSFPNQVRYHLFAQSVDDPTLLGWFPDTNDGLGEMIGPRVIESATDHPTDSRDFLWVGGEFTRVNGDPQWSLTRFATGPDTGAPAAVEAQASSLSAGQVEVSWRSSADLDDSLLTYHVYRDGDATPVHTAQGSSLPWKRPQMSFTDTGVTVGQSYGYRVEAVDAAGNSSGLSPTASATVAAAGQPYADAVLADGPELYWRYSESSGGYAADSSGNDNSGVHRGGPDTGVLPPAADGPDAAAIGHDGDNSYTYSDTGFASTDEFSVETWFRTTTGDGGKLIGFGNRILQNSTWYDRHVYMTDDGRLVFGVYPGSTQTISTWAGYNDGAWHHVVATLSGDGMRLYVDGELEASRSWVTSGQDFGTTLGYWRAGGDRLGSWPGSPSSDYFAGDLDETAVYHHALSPARVAAHHAAASVPTDTVVEVTPTADTYVNEFAAGSQHGTHQQLNVRGYPGYESYLRFDAPAAPAGTVLKAASLRITLTTSSSAGSLDEHQVAPILEPWSEAATTYTNRPAVSDTPWGLITGADAPGTVHTVTLDTASVAAALGGDVDLALVSEGGDSLKFASREAPQSSRPHLLLTFGAP